MNALNGDFGKAEGHFRHALKADPKMRAIRFPLPGHYAIRRNGSNV